MTRLELSRAEFSKVLALVGGLHNGPVVRALRKAGGTALRDMRSETHKRVRARKRIRVAAIRQALKLNRASGTRIEDLEWSVVVTGKPIRLVDYPHRQNKKGVSVAVNKGKRSVVKGAFIATMKSGHKGVFVRRGNRRLPIDERFGSRVIDAVSHKGETDAILRRGRLSFDATFLRVLPMEMSKR